MKIKSLLIGMLASIALVGCTNEDPIDMGTEDSKQSELVRGDAYVNFVINTKTDSSRGTVGDYDGNKDDSKHHVTGSEAENKVDKVLLIIAKVDENNQNAAEPTLYTGVKTLAKDKVANGYVGYPAITQDATTITMNAPIRLDYTGQYAVLAVINPAPGLQEMITEGGDHKAAYEAVLSYSGDDAYTVTTKDNTKTYSYFQMSNKEVCVVTATDANNTPDNAVNASIAVERTVSKTTWRWNENKCLDGELSKIKNNVYPVKVFFKENTPVQASFWYLKDADADTKEYFYSEEFNKAKDVDGKEYWVLFKKDQKSYTDPDGQILLSAVEAIFAAAAKYDKYTGVLDDTADEKEGEQSTAGATEKSDYLLPEDYKTASNTEKRVTSSMLKSLSFVYQNEAKTKELTYYVHLNKYALTNLTEDVYAVRHIDNGTSVRTMGILGSSEYLVTPYYADINKGESVTFKTGSTLAEVTEDADNNTLELFSDLPTSGSAQSNTGHYLENTGVTKEVGGFMEYLYENSCKASAVSAGTVTGLVLAGDIYDDGGNKVEILYKYNQQYYRTLQALVESVGKNGVLTISTTGKDGNKVVHNITPNSSNEEADAAGIDVYENGRCFYYSAQIKHYDNAVKDTQKDGGIGVMEFAIMRNNIYSLGVKSIQAIGDARITVTQNTPIADVRAYIDLEVSILPWIVRFNDLDL